MNTKKNESEISFKTPQGFDQLGVLWVNDVDENSAADFCAAVIKQASQHPIQRPLIVYIDSNGGDVDALNSMLAVLDSVPNQVVTVAMGKAKSAGAILLSHGDVRFVSPHSTVMIHQVFCGTEGVIDDTINMIELFKKENDKLLKLLSKNCKYPGGYRALKKLLVDKHELYLDAQEAVDFGIADQIGVPRLCELSAYDIVLM